jgi:four helix bundle protein
MTINRFEDLDVYKKALELDADIYKFVIFKSELSKDFALRDQINKSSGSIADNIAEGFERDGNKEFCQFLYISKASSSELRSQIYRAYKRGHVTKEEIIPFVERCKEISRSIRGFIDYLSKSEMKGRKYAKQK